MTYFDPAGQSYSLTPTSSVGAMQAISNNCIGNLYAISAGQSIAIVPEAEKSRLIWIFNVGLLPVILSTIQTNIVAATTQKLLPDGLHIPCGDFYELKTSCTIYAAVPLVPKFFSATALFQPKALVSTGVEV